MANNCYRKENNNFVILVIAKGYSIHRIMFVRLHLEAIILNVVCVFGNKLSLKFSCYAKRSHSS